MMTEFSFLGEAISQFLHNFQKKLRLEWLEITHNINILFTSDLLSQISSKALTDPVALNHRLKMLNKTLLLAKFFVVVETWIIIFV